MSDQDFQQRTLQWFDEHGRTDLPWQNPRDAYRVWISEIMLQQTQVATVRGYFERFIVRFPDSKALASADLDEVLSLWSGLGYYARARHLHQAADLVHRQHEGRLPQQIEALLKLPGIGRSTAGAILSLGYGQPAAILDGNVRRLLARFFRVEGWPGQTHVQAQLWALSEALVPRLRPDAFNQALMDLGALICLPRQPQCPKCPHVNHCRAYRDQVQQLIPTPRPKRAMPVRTCFWLILRSPEGRVYLESRPPKGLWGGLLSFPELASEVEIPDWFKRHGFAPIPLHRRPSQRHTFSHFHLEVTPLFGHVPSPSEEARARLSGFFEDAAVERVPAPVRELLGTL